MIKDDLAVSAVLSLIYNLVELTSIHVDDLIVVFIVMMVMFSGEDIGQAEHKQTQQSHSSSFFYKFN